MSNKNVFGSVLKNLKKGFLITFSAVLVLFLGLQATFFSTAAIAAPFGKQIEKMTEGVKTDMAIDKVAGTTKQIGRDLRDGRTDKVIDTVSDTTKDISKELGNRAKDVAKDVKKGTKENLGKAKDVAKDVKKGTKENLGKAKNVAKDATNNMNDMGDNVEYSKNMAGDRAVEALDKTKEESNKGVNGVIDSVKDFLGQ